VCVCVVGSVSTVGGGRGLVARTVAHHVREHAQFLRGRGERGGEPESAMRGRGRCAAPRERQRRQARKYQWTGEEGGRQRRGKEQGRREGEREEGRRERGSGVVGGRERREEGRGKEWSVG
jgi:hypothetical protein